MAQDLSQKMAEKSEQELLAMLASPDDWTSEALHCAKAELRKRGVDNPDAKLLNVRPLDEGSQLAGVILGTLRKYGPILLLILGLLMSFRATVLLEGHTLEATLRDLRKSQGLLLILLFQFSPFVGLAVLTCAARVFKWHRAALLASLFTDYTVSLLSIALYTLLAIDTGESHGHPGPAMFLLLIPIWSWCGIVGLWLVAWVVCLLGDQKKDC